MFVDTIIQCIDMHHNVNKCIYACNRQVFGPDCVDPIYIRIDPHLQRKFLNTHNELRNQQAMGEKGNILKPPVADMATMVRSENLISHAKFTGCILTHVFFWILQF